MRTLSSMGKKGDLELNTLWALGQLFLIAALVLFPLLQFTSSNSFKLFERTFLSKDFALTLDAIYTAPQELVMIYDQPTQGVGLNISRMTVKAFYEGALNAVTTPTSTYHFMEDNVTKINHIQFSLKELMPYADKKERDKFAIQPSIMKQGDQITLNVMGFQYDPEMQTVISVPTSGQIRKIVINKLHEAGTEELTDKLAEFIVEILGKEKVFDSIEITEARNPSEIISSSPDLILNIKIMNDPESENRITILLSADGEDADESDIKQKRSKLSSLLINSFRMDKLRQRYQYEPQERYVQDDSLLDSFGLSATIIFGNIAHKQGADFLTFANYPSLAAIVYNAIIAYNK